MGRGSARPMLVRAPGVSAPASFACPGLAAIGRDDEGCDSAGPPAKCAIEVTGPVLAGLSRSSGHLRSQSSPCVCGGVISRSPCLRSSPSRPAKEVAVRAAEVRKHISRAWLTASKRSRVST